MKRSESGLIIIVMVLFILILTGVYSMFNLVHANNVVSIDKQVILMEVLDIRKYSNDSMTMIAFPDGTIMNNLFPGDDVYEVKFKHDNHIDKVEGYDYYEYCKDKVGESIYLEIEIYELKSGVYEHKIVDMVDEES